MNKQSRRACGSRRLCLGDLPWTTQTHGKSVKPGETGSTAKAYAARDCAQAAFLWLCAVAHLWRGSSSTPDDLSLWLYS
jgi:hypothetical protein